MNSENISPSAKLIGQTQISGERTRIGAGAVIENSYLENVVVEEGATIRESVLITREEIEEHKCDNAGKWIARGAPVAVGKNAEVVGSTVVNAAIGAETRCFDSHIEQAQIGPDNSIRNIKGLLFRSGERVVLEGPTEISEAWLGDYATVDQCGYFEGVFSNDFYIFEFAKQSRGIEVVDTLQLPHVSRYGMNAINSTNSGNVLPQPDDRFSSFGEIDGLWSDSVLSHEPILLSPCCWVSGWTKVIGKSLKAHASAKDLIEDSLATYLMPFSVSGLEGGSVMGQVTIGELSNSYSYKQRIPLWTFSHACSEIIDMVQKMHSIVKDGKLIDRLVTLSLKNALALTYFYAAERNIDLDADTGKSGKGWRGWLARSKGAIEKHLASDLWHFEEGEPVNWKRDGDRWVPKNAEMLLGISPDALENQFSGDDLLKCGEEPLDSRLGISRDELYTGETFIEETAEVAETAEIGKGVRITGNSRIGEGVRLFGARVHNSAIEKNGLVLRSNLTDSEVGENLELISSLVDKSKVGGDSTVNCGRIVDSEISGNSTISPFADIARSRIARPVIIGGGLRDAEIDTILMSMHMAGDVSGIKAHPLEIDCDGRTEILYPIPMLGGGCRLKGSREKPIGVECSFVGSNAIVEGGAYIGFGAFVLGRLTEEEGLLPFTVSTEAGPAKDQIGGVLSSFANIVITHFISWAYQGNEKEKAELIPRMIKSQIQEGCQALEWMRGVREEGKDWEESSPYARFKSLRLYTDKQLEAGLVAFVRELEESKWDLKYDEELTFCGKGSWSAVEGALRWKEGD
ncbi:MAG: hypothetical protein HOC74_09805 [Gemmatimonadetes bacterium]|jgi:NDP-sugar pyrophosphorylase family protein|nr:hypothetical protein [Gemmatimonadota bacterium]